MSRLFPFFIVVSIIWNANAASDSRRVSLFFLDSATVSDTVVRLGDISRIQFCGSTEDVETISKTVIGESAPAGYYRQVNTNDVFDYTLNRVLKGFSFDRPLKKMVKVATNCQEHATGEYAEQIVKYISDSTRWQPGDYTVTLRNENQKFKCYKGPFTLTVSGAVSKYPRGNVNVKLVVKQGTKAYSVPVVCYVTVSAPVVVAKTTIARGDILTPENCMIEKRDITRFGYEPFVDLSGIHNMIATRTIPKETILYEKLTTGIPVVLKDEQVYLVVNHGPVTVSVIMRAREKGALGDRIWVQNDMNHKLFKVKIVGKGLVQLLQGVKTI